MRVASDTPCPRPWGHKLTITAYFAGTPTDTDLNERVDAVNAALPAAAFVGVACEPVTLEPQGQVAT